MKYDIIATGSSGNAVVINDRLLIDIGVPYHMIHDYADKLMVVLLTHQHGDHFRLSTVRSLARKRPALRWACGEWMVDPLLRAGVNIRCIDVIEMRHVTSYKGIAAVMPERLTHNVPNCGWHIFINGESLFYATDTGTLDGIRAQGYDLYMVESNHTRAELDARIAEKQSKGEYSYEINAAQYHLSREQAIDWLTENIGPKSLWVPMHGHKDKGGTQDGRPSDACEDNN